MKITIKPKIINKRRYYSTDQVTIIKFIKALLKDHGMTIKGVKKILSLNNVIDGESDSPVRDPLKLIRSMSTGTDE